MKAKRSIIRAFPDYRIELRTDSYGNSVFATVDSSTRDVIYSSKNYELAYRRAIYCQEQITGHTKPDGFSLVPLIQRGSLGIYRTTDIIDGVLSWVYIIKDIKTDEICGRAESFAKACIQTFHTIPGVLVQ